MKREDYIAGRGRSVSQKLRAQWKDYTKSGWYFITLGADYHRQLFGTVKDGEMCPNDLGKIVEEEWIRTGKIRSHIRLGSYQVMPNHFHGLIYLGSSPKPQSLGRIINAFKGAVTRKWRMVVSRRGGNLSHCSASEQVWQPNYYDVVCFEEEELAQKEAYIRANPMRWALRDIPSGMMKTSAFKGNSSLRQGKDFCAVKISRKASDTEIANIIERAKTSTATFVSTFISPGEHSLLDILLDTPTAKIIWLVPTALPEHIPVKWSRAFLENRALWISPFPEITEVTREQCQFCNNLVEKMAMNRNLR